MRTTVPVRKRWSVRTALVLALAAVLSSTGASLTASSATAAPRTPVFAVYYLWWTANHWQARLGGNFPHNSTPLPLPATLDSTGCAPKSKYTGNKLTDVPTGGGYDQNDAAVIERDVRLAASLGIKGFAVNWRGAGTSTQTVSSDAFNKRLQYVFDAVHKVNAEGIPFKLMLDYQASTVKLSRTTFNGDLSYFSKRYGTDSALDHTYSKRPELVWAGSWKYTAADLGAVASSFRSKLFLIGDEKPGGYNATRGAKLDGVSYYWSSQDPWRNPASFDQVRKLANAVHAGKNPDGATKTWLAPFTPGYDASLLYGTNTCVQRRDGQTMHKLFQGNLASQPDGWTFISWNEIAEGSYIVPLTRYGKQYTDELKTVITNNG